MSVLTPDAGAITGGHPEAAVGAPYIVFEHQDLDFMVSIGLPADPIPKDLVTLNVDFFEWNQPTESTDLDIAGLELHRFCGHFVSLPTC